MSVFPFGLGTVSKRFKALVAAVAVVGLTALPAAAQDAGAAPAASDAAPVASPAAEDTAASPAEDAAATTEIDPDAVVATVNGEPITERDLAIVGLIMGDQLTQFPQENWREIEIDVAIQFKLFAGAARGEGLDQDVDFLAEMAVRAEESLRAMYVQTVIVPTITEDDLTAAYEAAVAGMNLPEEVQIAAISVATEAEANDVIRRLGNGEEFADLAFELSLDRATAEAGGVIDQYWQPGQLIQELDDVIFTLQSDQVLAYPLQIGDQWHVIKVMDHRTQAPPAYETLRDTLLQQLVTQAYTTTLDDLRNNADVQMTGEETAPASDAAAPASDAAAPASDAAAPASDAAAPASDAAAPASDAAAPASAGP